MQGHAPAVIVLRIIGIQLDGNIGVFQCSLIVPLMVSGGAAQVVNSAFVGIPFQSICAQGDSAAILRCPQSNPNGQKLIFKIGIRIVCGIAFLCAGNRRYNPGDIPRLGCAAHLFPTDVIILGDFVETFLEGVAILFRHGADFLTNILMLHMFLIKLFVNLQEKLIKAQDGNPISVMLLNNFLDFFGGLFPLSTGAPKNAVQLELLEQGHQRLVAAAVTDDDGNVFRQRLAQGLDPTSFQSLGLLPAVHGFIQQVPVDFGDHRTAAVISNEGSQTFVPRHQGVGGLTDEEGVFHQGIEVGGDDQSVFCVAKQVGQIVVAAAGGFSGHMLLQKGGGRI